MSAAPQLLDVAKIPAAFPANVFMEIASAAVLARGLLREAVGSDDVNLAAAAADLVDRIGFIADAASQRAGGVVAYGDALDWLMSPACLKAFGRVAPDCGDDE